MAAIKAENTKIELRLRRFLHSHGYRYSLHKKALPGRPDIFLKKYSAVIFVHGCFWHCHKGCKDAGIPKSNKHFWSAKLKANVKRDIINKAKLSKLGYKVIVVWECEINKGIGRKLERRIKKVLI